MFYIFGDKFFMDKNLVVFLIKVKNQPISEKKRHRIILAK